jgi:hypothetical protein
MPVARMGYKVQFLDYIDIWLLYLIKVSVPYVMRGTRLGSQVECTDAVRLACRLCRRATMMYMCEGIYKCFAWPAEESRSDPQKMVEVANNEERLATSA